MSDTATDIGARFRALHRPGAPFILANVWDAGSARMLAALGAEALATSSAAHAFTLGRGDQGKVSRDEALAHAEAIVQATPLPVSGDFENGFGDAPESVAETVRLAAQAGLAGISIEDIAHPTGQAYEREHAMDRIRAAVEAARSLPGDFVLTARADGVLEGVYDLEEGITRLKAFDALGADCLYLPIPPAPSDIPRIVAAVSGPVNVLVAGEFATLSRADYAAMGVARLSLGAALARVTHKVISDLGEAMLSQGDFTGLTRGASGGAIDALLVRGGTG